MCSRKPKPKTGKARVCVAKRKASPPTPLVGVHSRHPHRPLAQAGSPSHRPSPSRPAKLGHVDQFHEHSWDWIGLEGYFWKGGQGGQETQMEQGSINLTNLTGMLDVALASANRTGQPWAERGSVDSFHPIVDHLKQETLCPSVPPRLAHVSLRRGNWQRNCSQL